MLPNPVPTGSDTVRQLEDLIDQVGKVIRGKRGVVRQVLAAVLARGHVLLEDVPGVGKTTLARAFSKVMGCAFSRVQFTADMLPSDIVGVEVLDPQTGAFSFRQGPIFSELVLADEINRASPKTQSAMLEAMADRQITTENRTYGLPEMFVVLATQNPAEHHGVYPLPESQLDRFMIRIELGYPDRSSEHALISAPDSPKTSLDDLEPVLTPGQILTLQTSIQTVHMSDSVASYLLSIVEATRNHLEIALGCSPRGALDFARYARALAFLEGRDFVTPDDVKNGAPMVLGHRLMIQGQGGVAARVESMSLVEGILNRIPVPR